MILTKIVIYKQTVVKLSNIIFHDYRFSGCIIVSRYQTDGQTVTADWSGAVFWLLVANAP
jgi:hypothetical protein